MIMKLITKILMLAVMAGAFCSCDADEDGKETLPVMERIKISYSYSNSQDYFDLMNVKVEYMDAEGTLKVETITKAWKYEAEVAYASAPTDYKFNVYVQASQTGLEQPKDQYKIQQEYTASVSAIMSDGKSKSLGYITLPNQGNVVKDKINEYLDLHKQEKLVCPFELTLEK